MQDKLVIDHDGRMYAIAIDDLAAFEVVDDATKAEFRAERDSGSDAEGFGFGDPPALGGLPTPGEIPKPGDPPMGDLRGTGDLGLRPTVFILRR
jgi:hypothetical protein